MARANRPKDVTGLVKSPTETFKRSKTASLVAALTMVHAVPALGCEVDISNYVGWQIVYSGTVTGYISEDGREESDFEGCEYGRVLIVDYLMQVTCAEYSYSYAFHPDIVILSNGPVLKACIDDEMYDISR
ncbi:MAG: hypothetical protein OXI33_12185 [Chloroflexota bacterium]|nr:hypothetical protein [Chloroflexota bacterium]